MNQLDNTLIENALALTGKTMEDMTEPEFVHRTQGFPELYHGRLNWLFSIGKFYAFLLSPEFIEKYWSKIHGIKRGDVIHTFGKAIYEYQRRDETYPEGNEKPLIELLSKIK